MQWNDVMATSKLEPGQIVTVERESGDLVLWRTAGGTAVACAARCPHQWAHLGSTGAVDGDELVCRSHFWRFSQEGAGSKLAAHGRRDEKSPVKTVAVREINGRLEILEFSNPC
ncbi:MAG: Rieske 2Fe-2S domain-containing protein [Acidimicrobiales bacterium]